jgi:predicted flavoprotein YhiN
VQVPRGTKSLSQHLKSRLKLDGVKTTLLYETNPNLAQMSSMQLAQLIKGVPILLGKPRPIAEAISTAGGVQAACMHSPAQLQAWPGVFCAGEMLDWDAPTGGYLLTACLATGRHAGLGAWQHLQAAQATLKSHTP